MRDLWAKADGCFNTAGVVLKARKSMWSAGGQDETSNSMQSAHLSRSTLPNQGCTCALCLATHASYIPVAMWPSE
eukprot:6103046-Pyramimonas_sp.AAC.1